MPQVGYGSLAIIPSFDGFQGKLEMGSGKAMIAAGTSGGEKFGNAASKSAKSKLSTAAKTIVAPLLAGFAALKVKDFIGDSIAEARESQKVGALTTQVIKSTGKAAHVTAKQVGSLATAISNKTGIDDEAVQAGENMLLTFKNVRNETGKGNKIFSKASGIVTDMAAAMAGGHGGPIDLKASAIQVGKALGDPVKGVTALSKVGVTFDDQQKKQIATLVKHGKTLDAQKIILHELTSEFGGAAAAQSTAGEKVATAFGNIKEGIGTALLPALDDLEHWFLKKGIPALQDFTGWMQNKGVPAVEKFAKRATPFVKDVLQKTRDLLKEATPYAKDFVGYFKDVPSGVWKTAAAVGGIGIVGKKLGLGKLIGSTKSRGGLSGGSGILGLVSKAKPVPVVVMNKGFTPGTAAGGAATAATPARVIIGRVATLAVSTAAAVTIAHKIKSATESHFDSSKTGKFNPEQAVKNVGVANTGGGFFKHIPKLPLLGGQPAQAAEDDLKRIDDRLTHLVNSGKIDAATNQFAALKREANKQHVALKDVTDYLPHYEAAIQRATDKVKRYGAALDNLPRRVVTDFIQNVIRHHDFGTGSASPGAPNRTPAGINIHTMNIKGDPDKWKREMEHARRAAALGGADFK